MALARTRRPCSAAKPGSEPDAVLARLDTQVGHRAQVDEHGAVGRLDLVPAALAALEGGAEGVELLLDEAQRQHRRAVGEAERGTTGADGRTGRVGHLMLP